MSRGEYETELGYDRHSGAGSLDIRLFPQHDAFLNLGEQIHRRNNVLIKMHQDEYEALLPGVIGSSLELCTPSDGSAQELLGTIDLNKDKDEDDLDPMLRLIKLVRRSGELARYDVMVDAPKQHSVRMRLSEESSGSTITVEYDSVDHHIELRMAGTDHGVISYADLIEMTKIFAMIHDAISINYYQSGYRLTQPKPIPVVVGKTGHGTVSDLQLALVLEIGKTNLSRNGNPILFGPDIIGASIDVMSDITDVDYEQIAKRLLAEKADEHPDSSYALTHLDLLQAIQKAI